MISKYIDIIHNGKECDYEIMLQAPDNEEWISEEELYGMYDIPFMEDAGCHCWGGVGREPDIFTLDELQRVINQYAQAFYELNENDENDGSNNKLRGYRVLQDGQFIAEYRNEPGAVIEDGETIKEAFERQIKQIKDKEDPEGHA